MPLAMFRAYTCIDEAVTKKRKSGKSYFYICPRKLSLWVNTFLLLEGSLREKMNSERSEVVSKPVKKRKGPVTKTELVIHQSIFLHRINGFRN